MKENVSSNTSSSRGNTGNNNSGKEDLQSTHRSVDYGKGEELLSKSVNQWVSSEAMERYVCMYVCSYCYYMV